LSTRMTPQQFVNKWKAVELKESSAAREHFRDICRLIGHPTPIEYDKKGDRFCFEKGATKESGGRGFADVWFKDHFGWEYKSKGANLDAAYRQLLQYRESLENPWLLIVSDMERIIIHTNFHNTVNREIAITFEDLLTPEGREPLRLAFFDPEKLKAKQTTEQVTQEAAKEFGRLSDHLRKWGEDPQDIAHFLIRILFCLFAEDIGLLPRDIFTRLAEQTSGNTQAFTGLIRQLFSTMSTGGWFGTDQIPHFDGGLFDDASSLELDSDGISIINNVTKLDWASIEPAIIGTLFERSLDPAKRAQLGAHYTSKEDILLIVEPVLMAPLRRQWSELQDKVFELAARRDEATNSNKADLNRELTSLLTEFANEVSTIRVLDPACGSGNFLYVALRQLLDLEKEIIILVSKLGLKCLKPQVSPHQLYGIEVNEYAHELAQTTVWIGFIQWLYENGFGWPKPPILKSLDNIQLMDAILAYDSEGKPSDPIWPKADIIVGNPPFLGAQKLRRELGDQYVDHLFSLYRGRVLGAADLVCYWFERARQSVQELKTKRVGLLATQAIRAGASRRALERIKSSGDIFMAWSDRQWVLNGADVRVSLVGFDSGNEAEKTLDGTRVRSIHANLSTGIDVTLIKRLIENQGLGFEGIKKNGPFELTADQAKRMYDQVGNPDGVSNSDVVKRWVNAYDITRRSRNRWIIDFSSIADFPEASCYEMPFEYIKTHVKPIRMKSSFKQLKRNWWKFGRSRPAMRHAINNLERFLVTPRVSKHRIFVWLEAETVPDWRLNVFAREDYYFFGVLHSRAHEIWTLHTSSRHGVGNDPTYNNRICFETFPFPWPPGRESINDPRVVSVSETARQLVERRDNWLNPSGLSEKDLKKRTLTNLYNCRPTWLDLAHKRLDDAVFAAYGWPDDLTDQEILEKLLALNLQRAERTDFGR